MFTLIAAFGATFAAMALMLSLGGRLSAETLAVALLILVLGFIAVLFTADSLRARPVGGSSGFQLFTRRHSRRWPLPVVLLLSLVAVAYVAFRPASLAPVPATAAAGMTSDAVSPPAATPSGNVPVAADMAVPAAPAAATPAPAADPKEDIRAAVEAWRTAWTKRDVPRYLSAYTSDFHPADGASHAAWQAQRRERLRGARGLQVRVDQLEVEADGDRATARFVQHYRAGAMDEKVRKRLVFVRSADSWKISEEAVETPSKP
jgi:ketosteroid isomerase-like protein